MKEQILKILEEGKKYGYNNNAIANELLNLFSVSGSYCKVSEKEPQHNIELIAKAPDGTKHLTSWRPIYGIFCCQDKRDSAFDWEWLLV